MDSDFNWEYLERIFLFGKVHFHISNGGYFLKFVFENYIRSITTTTANIPWSEINLKYAMKFPQL